jgi:hypothetical protein
MDRAKRKRSKNLMVQPPSKVIEETIEKAKNPQPKTIYQDNWNTFKSMKGCFNADVVGNLLHQLMLLNCNGF